MQTIRAEIVGNTCTALGITAHGSAPVLALCRKLIEAGHDPSLPLHAYRGDVLSLKVRSIGEGAQLTVQDSKGGRPRFLRWREGVGQPQPFAEMTKGYRATPCTETSLYEPPPIEPSRGRACTRERPGKNANLVPESHTSHRRLNAGSTPSHSSITATPERP